MKKVSTLGLILLSLFTAIAVQAGTDDRLTRLENITANQNQQLQELSNLQSQVQDLRGQVEMLNHENAKLKQQQVAYFADLDERLQVQEKIANYLLKPKHLKKSEREKLFGGTTSAAVPVAAASTTVVEPVAATAPVPQATAPMVTDNMGTPAAPPATPFMPATQTAAPVQTTASQTAAGHATTFPALNTPAAVPPVTAPATVAVVPAQAGTGVQQNAPIAASPAGVNPVVSASTAPASNDAAAQEASAYQAAFNGIKERQYAQAQVALQNFLKAYPNSSYLPNVHYWLGELNLVQGHAPEARKEFELLITQYPQNSKVPDALLKIAFIDYDSGHQKAAMETLKSIQAKYPNTAAASLAKAKLESLNAIPTPH